MSWTKRVYGHRPDVQAWLIYDWANSAFFTIIIATVFPVFYAGYANSGASPSSATFRFSVAATLAASVIALAAPFLGAIADITPLKKRFMMFFVGLGVLATALMATISEGQWLWASILFIAANMGAMGSIVFYDAFLPHLAKDDELDTLSTQGFALGYVSGALVLLLALLATSNPKWFGFEHATAVAKALFVVIGLWWGFFSIPFFRRVREPEITDQASIGTALKTSARAVITLTQKLKRYPQAFRFLIAFLVFNDGVGTVIKMAAIYGTEMGLKTSTLLSAILLVQCIGIPFTLLFGRLANRIGAKHSIYIALAVYGAVSVLGFIMTTANHFYLLAILIGMVQGGVQALSRSIFASLIPKQDATQFFGLFAVFEKFAGIFGPLLFAIVIAATGQTRYAILGVALFFVVGAVLLSRVDIASGRRDIDKTFA